MKLPVAPRFLLCCALLAAAPLNAAPLPESARVLHLLNRLGYGPRPGEIEKVESMGIDAYIKAQLAPDTIPEPPALENDLHAYTTLHMTPDALFQVYGPPPVMKGQKPDPQLLKAARRRARVILREAVEARLERAVESPRQLQQVMAAFWFNHFNVFAGKGLDHLWIGAYEEEAIRPYSLGRFRDLLEATAKHPAMLFYLDNWQNSAPHHGKGPFKGINENYARELMELHTVGVNGGYTQQDVIALARILSGWGFKPRPGRRPEYTFYFDPRRHDYGDKVFLGHLIKGQGEQEGEEALDILARSPATARFISTELARYFVADRPPASLVARLSQRYLASDGNIRDVLDTLFHSPEFWDPRYFGNKFKTPYQYVVSAVRAAGVKVGNFRPLMGALYQLGMPPYLHQAPDGYKDTQEAWLNPDAMTRRLSFATALGAGRLPLNSDPPHPLDPGQLLDTLGPDLSPQSRTIIRDAPPDLRAALVLGSPEFMHY